MRGKLYLCATPIGNLEDITLRVLRTLKKVDLIAAEDTRNSIKLLNHFEIKTPMTSYHEYNKIEKAYALIEKMQNGMNVALITDAGTPGISDPGEELAAMCYDAGIEVTSLPGPAACITALTLSGLPTRRFAFEAFLPMEKKERREILSELVNETRTIIIYEAPHKLVRTLKDLYETLGNRRMTLCRELTKKHETAFRTTIADLIAYYENEKPLGECVLVIEGKSRQELKEEAVASWEEISIEEISKIEKSIFEAGAMSKMLDQNLTLKEIAQKITGDKDVKVIDASIEPKYNCGCSKEKFAGSLVTLGEKQLKELIEEDEKAEIKCQFCNKTYQFNKEELEGILERAQNK